jgi:hypothetical protein
VSLTYIPLELRRLVVARSGERCEYCLLPASVAFFPHEIDHVIAEKHGGVTAAENLAFACWRCNRHKGSDLGSFDLHTHVFAFLFNPRTQSWTAHFAFHSEHIVGLTPEGRATVSLLRLNSEERLAERQRLRGRG